MKRAAATEPPGNFLAALADICQGSPEHIALEASGGQGVDGGSQLSYRELWRRLSGAGAGLRARGVELGDRVGILYGRSADFVLALLACWHAGAVWVPLADLPNNRLAALCERIRPTCLLGPEHVTLRELEASAAGPCEPFHPVIGSPAYLIFTSGSTGEPKGVLLPHDGILGMLRAQIDCFRLTPDARSLWLLSPLFDASLSDIGTALLSGATLVIDPAPLCSLAHFYRLLAEFRITYIDLPPSLLASLDPARLPDSLATVVIGGEAAPADQLSRWSEKLNLINVYGPTEATVCTSAGRCEPRQPAGLLGQPWPGVVYRLDGEKPRPGQTGELWIHSPGLALDYWEQPELTARRLVEKDGLRWYRSGDLVEFTSDGDYRFLGRIDRQFKHNGRLICPEEIESVLSELSGVRKALVVRHSGGALCACLDGEKRERAELAEQLANRLPAWMIPSLWLWPEPWPLTASGKPDLARLAAWPLAQDTADLQPLSEAESSLAAIWSRLLGCPVQSCEADFFALGGSSIQVLACVALAAEAGLILSPESFYKARRLSRIVAAADVEHQERGMSAEALRSRLPADLGLLAVNRAPDRLSTVLLTGATGFFGSRLLAELLRATDWRIQCLVRAESPAEGRSRLVQALASWHAPLEDRVEVLCGELTRPDLGLSHPERLREAQAIIHCAAAVDLVRDFESLYAPNVAALAHLTGHPALLGKPLHYVSTLSVLVAAGNKPQLADEADDLRQTDRIYGGYAQSKWAAEVWLRRQMARGLPATVYRPGLITADSSTGRGPCRDWLGGLIRGLLTIGAVPAECPAAERLQVDITPVDYAASAMIELMLGPQRAGATWHLANPRPLALSSLLDTLAAWGRLERLPLVQWQERAMAHLRRSPGLDESAALLAMCRALTEPDERWHSLDLFQATGIRLASPVTAARLEAAGIYGPPPDRALLERYFAGYTSGFCLNAARHGADMGLANSPLWVSDFFSAGI